MARFIQDRSALSNQSPRALVFTGEIEETTGPLLKDLLDLSTQAVEIIDAYRDMLSDQLAVYNTIINNKLNEIMKV